MPTAAGAATLPPSADGEFPAEVQRKTPRPERANPPAAVRAPRWVGAEKEPPVRGEHAHAVRAPRLSGAEKEPPCQGEPACGSSSALLGRCRKGAARRGEHANAVRAPRWVDAENPGNPEKIFPPEKAAKTPVLTLRNVYPNGIVSKT